MPKRERRGVHPAFEYAMAKLGYVVSHLNARLFTDEQLDEWDAAVEEWCDQHPDIEQPP